MKSLYLFSVICAVLTFSTQSVNAQIFEDQLLVCDHTNECQIINIDNFINKDNATKLQYNFDHDLDTFSLRD